MIRFKKEFKQLHWVKYKKDREHNSLDRELVSFLLAQITLSSKVSPANQIGIIDFFG